MKRKSLKSEDGTKIHYQVKKSSDHWILFLHGIGNSSTFWDKEAKIFQELGFSTLVPDLRGHGRSDKPTHKNAYHLKSFAEDIHNIMDKESIPHSHVIGHSFGGIVGIAHYKAEKAKVKSLVVVNLDYKVPNKVRLLLRLKPLLRALKRWKWTKYHDKEALDFYLTDTANHIIQSLHNAVKEDTMKKRKLFDNIKVPVLFIKSKKDRVIPQRDLERAYMMMHGAEMVEVERAHHDLFPQMPKTAGKYILNFLKKNKLVDQLNFSKIVSLMLPALGIGLLSSPEFLIVFMQGGITGASVIGGTTLATKVGGIFIFKTIFAGALLWIFHHSNKN